MLGWRWGIGSVKMIHLSYSSRVSKGIASNETSQTLSLYPISWASAHMFMRTLAFGSRKYLSQQYWNPQLKGPAVLIACVPHLRLTWWDHSSRGVKVPVHLWVPKALWRGMVLWIVCTFPSWPISESLKLVSTIYILVANSILNPSTAGECAEWGWGGGGWCVSV